MTDPGALTTINEVLAEFDEISHDACKISYAIIGALALAGYAIVQVDHETLRRVIAETPKISD